MIFRAALVTLVMSLGTPLFAATAGEFYSDMSRRGVAAYQAGRYDEAARSLRIAAFGFVDAIEPYQSAQVYLALALERLGQEDEAREAVRKVLQAERVERRFASLSLPSDVRAAFRSVAGRALTVQESSLLQAPPPPSAAETPARKPVLVTATTAPQQQPPPLKPPAEPAVAEQAGRTQQEPAKSPVTDPDKPAKAPPAKAAEKQKDVQRQPAEPVTETAPPAAAAPPPATTTLPPPPPLPASSEEPDSFAIEVQEEARPVEEPIDSPAPSRPTPSRAELFSAAERALTTSNLAEARRVYRVLLGTPDMERASLIRVAEGLYRARDFALSLHAFSRVAPMLPGEEPYRYYIAVALYETGDFERAKSELAAALHHIELTPEVIEYRTRIERGSKE